MNRLCRIMLIIISQYFCRLRSTLCGFILVHQPSRFVARFYSQPQSNHYSMTLVTTSTVFSRFSLLKYVLSHCWHHWGCLMERHLPAIPQSQASNHVYVVCQELQRHCAICQLAFKWWLPSASNVWNCETKIFGLVIAIKSPKPWLIRLICPSASSSPKDVVEFGIATYRFDVSVRGITCSLCFSFA